MTNKPPTHLTHPSIGWGLNKFRKFGMDPNLIDNFEVEDYLSRIPSDPELELLKEPGTPPLLPLVRTSHPKPNHAECNCKVVPEYIYLVTSQFTELFYIFSTIAHIQSGDTFVCCCNEYGLKSCISMALLLVADI